MKSYQMPQSACLKCGQQLNDAVEGSKAATSRPKEGDVSVCFYCQNVAVFTETGTLRHPTPAEAERFAAADAVREAIQVSRIAQALDAAAHSTTKH